MKKNDILENILVEKLIFSGKGLSHTAEGKAIMIAGGVIPGSVVNLRVLKSRSNHLEAQLLDVVKPSPLEVELPSHYQVYGGCKWLPIGYEDQLRIKTEQVAECMESTHRYWGENAPVFHPIVASPEIYGYRNKVEFSFGKYISGREGVHDEFRFGFHKQGEFDRIIDCTYCVLASDTVNEIFTLVNELTRASGLPTYDPKSARGFYRHLVLRESKKTGEIMLIWSLNTNDEHFDDAGKAAFEKVWKRVAEHPAIVSNILLRNTGRADIVTGEQILLAGKDTIEDSLLGKNFTIRAKSFFQTNSLGAEKLYSIVRSLVKHPGGTLLDLYAGTGTIGIVLADMFSHVHSVEIVADASLDAVANAARNGVTQFEAVNAPVEKFLDAYLMEGKSADSLVIDPPRDGMHPSAPLNLLKFGVPEMIYVSCNPSTLARDLEVLLGSGKYRLTDVVPVDMFPHTHHIETVVRLEKIG